MLRQARGWITPGRPQGDQGLAWLRLLWAREDFNTKKVGMHFWKTPSVSKEGFMELSWLGLCWCRDRTGQDISALNNPCVSQEQPGACSRLNPLGGSEPQLTRGRCHGMLEPGEPLLVLTQMQNGK